ncbi:probable serine/threonine-protein kinase PBL18 [Rutidosis leptorrhynchoides]|uniref:probable serine/threonine-protein kinase PBL18 n=1 Tax=Rutidosis leptorrhynchoides TaxID=125765 RepID=UPI003A99CC66
MDEKILVYEHASSGSLDQHLNDVNLTWTKRLEICIDIASGLEFLHERKLAYNDHLISIVKDLYNEGKLDEMVFEGTNELYIEPQSLIIFKRIAMQCLNDKREERPTAGELVIQLKEALKIQWFWGLG